MYSCVANQGLEVSGCTKEGFLEELTFPSFLAQNQQDEFDQTSQVCVGQNNPVCDSSEATLRVAAVRTSGPSSPRHHTLSGVEGYSFDTSPRPLSS